MAESAADGAYRAGLLHRDVLRAGPEFIAQMGIDGAWIEPMSRHLGYSATKVYRHFHSKANLVHVLLMDHVAGGFEAVCVPADWTGAPPDVLRSMCVALLVYVGQHAACHRIYLAEHGHGHRAAATLQALALQLTYLTNNFQVALHACLPRRDFAELAGSAQLLLGQLLHLPLWWPPAPRGVQAGPLCEIGHDAWVCAQIGLLTGRRPDHRRVSGARLRVKSTAMPGEYADAARPDGPG